MKSLAAGTLAIFLKLYCIARRRAATGGDRAPTRGDECGGAAAAAAARATGGSFMAFLAILYEFSNV